MDKGSRQGFGLFGRIWRVLKFVEMGKGGYDPKRTQDLRSKAFREGRVKDLGAGLGLEVSREKASLCA